MSVVCSRLFGLLLPRYHMKKAVYYITFPGDGNETMQLEPDCVIDGDMVLHLQVS